ncbi:DNA damage-inducible protein 1 [Purpureocillium lilacinum]|uniref:DNA damage-inducible protein 1 n=1 Tax=Purpureocillium lilacinum TaxID=33203 RepID=A0A2U3E776_PURLI|nr:DNA damage-inducible protein 1 [Purpureocillium lilacinum]
MLLPLIVPLLIMCFIKDASSTSPAGQRDDTADDLLRTYSLQIMAVVEAAIRGTACYKDYVAGLKANKESPPNAGLVAGIHACVASSSGAWVQLRIARKTAQSPNFQRSGLITKALPDVLDTRTDHQGPYTRKLQRTLEDLSAAAKTAVEAYEAAKQSRAKVLDELKKPLKDRRINVTELTVRAEETDDGGWQLVVLGAVVAGVAVAGVVTYGPFIAADAQTARAVEALDEAATAIGDMTARFSAMARSNPERVNIGMAARLRNSRAEARRLLEFADMKLAEQDSLLPDVPADQRAEAGAIIHTASFQVEDARILIDRAAAWHLWFKAYVRSYRTARASGSVHAFPPAPVAGPQEAPSGPVGGQPRQGCWAGRLPRGVVTASGAAVWCPSQHPLTPQRPSFVPASPGTSTIPPPSDFLSPSSFTETRNKASAGQLPPATMRITLSIYNPQAANQDNLVTLDIFPDMTISTLRESIQADANIPPASQQIYHNGRLISDDSKTMEELQIADGDMLAVHVRPPRAAAAPAQAQRAQAARPPAAAPAQPQSQPRQGGDNDPEMVRLQVLGDPALRQQLQRQHLELAAAAEDPARFAAILRDAQDRERRERLERQREIERLNDDPFNIENQRKIEDMIRQERVMENLQNAMEHNPEVFGRVHMLYINVEVNGHKVKAFVDSGAQATIISPSCAEACGIMRLVDTRFAGVARGVGTANIIGRVHSAQIKIGQLHLPCSFTVMEGKSTDLLLGLDMLKRYQATIDLAKDKLCIQGEEVPFLGEADIPKDEEAAAAQEPTIPGPAGTSIGQRSGVVMPPGEAQQQQQQQQPTAPTPTPPAPAAQVPAAAAPNVTPAHVDSLMAMGATREQAVQALQAAEDNVDVAAGLIFF